MTLAEAMHKINDGKLFRFITEQDVCVLIQGIRDGKFSGDSTVAALGYLVELENVLCDRFGTRTPFFNSSEKQ
jgi:hypothetical protein